MSMLVNINDGQALFLGLARECCDLDESDRCRNKSGIAHDASYGRSCLRLPVSRNRLLDGATKFVSQDPAQLWVAATAREAAFRIAATWKASFAVTVGGMPKPNLLESLSFFSFHRKSASV